MFCILVSTLSDIYKNRVAILEKWQGCAGKTKSSKRSKYEALYTALFEWQRAHSTTERVGKAFPPTVIAIFRNSDHLGCKYEQLA